MNIDRTRRSFAHAALALLALAATPALGQVRVQFPQSRIDVASLPAPVATSPTPVPPLPTWDPYAAPKPPTSLARLFGVAPASGYAPISATALAPPVGAAPMYVQAPGASLQPAQGFAPAPYYAYQPAPVVAQPGGYCPPAAAPANCWRPGLYFEVGAVFLDRENRVTDRAILIDDDPPLNADNNLFRSSQFDFGYEVGPRLLIGYDFDQTVAYEATYYGIYTWDSSATFTAADDINVPGALGLDPTLDFFNADSATVSLDSDFHNFEINRIGSFSPAVAWILGFRYVRLTEDFALATSNPPTASQYDINTVNNLYGAQLGLRFRQTLNNFSYDLVGKAGVYGNSSSQDTLVGRIGDAPLRDFDISATDVAFVGEINFTGRYHISNSVALQGGYQVMWLNGVALAADQLDFTNAADSGQTLNSDGEVFIHGAHASLLFIF